MKVYLSGPISGKTYEGATSWRDDARRFLEGYGIEVLDPMRGKASLQGQSKIEDRPDVGDVLVQDAAIFHRDHWDVQRADIILVNLSEAGKRVSIGTVMEIAFAWVYRKIIILILPPGTVHEHAFVRYPASMRTEVLDDGLQLVLRTCGVVHMSDLSSSQ